MRGDGMADIQLIKGAANGNPSDSLPTMYDKVNKNTANINKQVVNHEGRLGPAEAAISNHSSRITEAETTLVNQDTRIDTLIINGDSSPAAAEAAIDTEGINRGTLKNRIDLDYLRTSAQLADTAVQIVNLRDYLNYMPINGGDFDGNDPAGPVIDGGTY